MYEGEGCTGGKSFEGSTEYQLTYGDRVVTPSGVEATELDVSSIFDEDIEPVVFLDLIYRNDNQLYFGYLTGPDTRATEINFDQYYTLK